MKKTISNYIIIIFVACGCNSSTIVNADQSNAFSIGNVNEEKGGDNDDQKQRYQPPFQPYQLPQQYQHQPQQNLGHQQFSLLQHQLQQFSQYHQQFAQQLHQFSQQNQQFLLHLKQQQNSNHNTAQSMSNGNGQQPSMNIQNQSMDNGNDKQLIEIYDRMGYGRWETFFNSDAAGEEEIYMANNCSQFTRAFETSTKIYDAINNNDIDSIKLYVETLLCDNSPFIVIAPKELTNQLGSSRAGDFLGNNVDMDSYQHYAAKYFALYDKPPSSNYIYGAHLKELNSKLSEAFAAFIAQNIKEILPSLKRYYLQSISGSIFKSLPRLPTGKIPEEPETEFKKQYGKYGKSVTNANKKPLGALTDIRKCGPFGPHLDHMYVTKEIDLLLSLNLGNNYEDTRYIYSEVKIHDMKCDECSFYLSNKHLEQFKAITKLEKDNDDMPSLLIVYIDEGLLQDPKTMDTLRDQIKLKNNKFYSFCKKNNINAPCNIVYIGCPKYDSSTLSLNTQTHNSMIILNPFAKNGEVAIIEAKTPAVQYENDEFVKVSAPNPVYYDEDGKEIESTKLFKKYRKHGKHKKKSKKYEPINDNDDNDDANLNNNNSNDGDESNKDGDGNNNPNINNSNNDQENVDNEPINNDKDVNAGKTNDNNDANDSKVNDDNDIANLNNQDLNNNNNSNDGNDNQSKPKKRKRGRKKKNSDTNKNLNANLDNDKKNVDNEPINDNNDNDVHVGNANNINDDVNVSKANDDNDNISSLDDGTYMDEDEGDEDEDLNDYTDVDNDLVGEDDDSVNNLNDNDNNQDDKLAKKKEKERQKKKKKKRQKREKDDERRKEKNKKKNDKKKERRKEIKKDKEQEKQALIDNNTKDDLISKVLNFFGVKS